jgi:hypothetical protein
MTQIRSHGRTAYLSYSTNVHPAESLDDLIGTLHNHVAPVSRAAFGAERASVNLRIGMKQIDEILSHPALPSNSFMSDDILAAKPSLACEKLLSALDELKLDVVSINAFPIRDFHAPRVKEQVYSPPWTDGGRALYSLKIAKALAHFMARPGIDRKRAAISVPSGVFKGLYGDPEEVRVQCAHFITECARELLRLERLTGRTVQLGLEPEPHTTAESCAEMIAYYELILAEARTKYPQQLQISRTQAEDLARRFITINLDLCHQAVEFEDPLDDLKKLQGAGVPISGLHLSAALAVKNTGRDSVGVAQLKALDEPRYLHQIVARKKDGTLVRFEDIPDLWNARKMTGMSLADFNELRCHFHVPLFADFAGELCSTRDSVGPAARYALAQGLTDNFVAETYTWNVLANLASSGNASARTVVGSNGNVDIHAGIVKELQWASAQLQQA